jgi:hypothetical protein
MAKIISQIEFTDYGQFEKMGDLERLRLALDGMDDERLVSKLESKRGNGRNDYPVRVMWNLIIAMKVFEHRTIASFRRELGRNSQLRRVCGLSDFAAKSHLVPPARVFTRFMKQLTEEQAGVDEMFCVTVSELAKAIPEFGKNTAGDGKYLDSYCKSKKNEKDGTKAAEESDAEAKDTKGTTAAREASSGDAPKARPGRRAEHDAKWSVKEYRYTDSSGQEKVRKEYHHGFKANIIADVKTELPMAYSVEAANCDEKREMKALLRKMPYQTRHRIETLALDRGYDSADMIRAVKNAGITPVVDIRRCWKDGEETKQYKDTDMVYDCKGTVYIYDDKGNRHKMKYEGYDRQKKCLRYSHCGKVRKIYVSYDERIFLPIARDSKKFERLYKGRTSVERLNGRLDRDFMFEDHCIRGLAKMRLMTSLALLIMNSMALGKIKQGNREHLAAVKSFYKKAS